MKAKGKYLTKRRHHESDLGPVRIGLGRRESTVLDEVGVDDGIKEVVVNGVVDVCVLVVVAPLRCSNVKRRSHRRQG